MAFIGLILKRNNFVTSLAVNSLNVRLVLKASSFKVLTSQISRYCETKISNVSRLWNLYLTAKESDSEEFPQSTVNPNAVFANNELNLSDIDVYGFDYDYTLVQYKDSVLGLIYDLARDYLIKRCKYPKEIESLNYVPNFAVRGLHYDFEQGVLMKVDSFHQIQLGSVYRGLTPINKDEIMKLYSRDTLRKDVISGSHSSMVQLSDLFSVPEMVLLSNVTEFFEKNNIPYHPQILFQDVKFSVSEIHPQMHNIITRDENIAYYLESNPDLLRLLEKMKNDGKTLFLVTNSKYSFVNSGLNFILGPDWQQLFDIIVVLARKPHFFQESKRPFRMYDTITKKHKWEKINSLEKGKIYMEGTVNQLHAMTGWEGSRVLYFGDHVYADLADVTHSYGWKTGAIISELRDEINTLNCKECRSAVNWLQTLQNLIEEIQDEDGADDLVNQLLTERDQLRLKTKHMFNKHFGSMFRTFHTPTYFSRRLFRFSDIYTSSITNLLNYSSKHTFYPRRGALPHES
ncbi:NT5DC3 (predicted) [Pycnogonum litorale]